MGVARAPGRDPPEGLEILCGATPCTGTARWGAALSMSGAEWVKARESVDAQGSGGIWLGQRVGIPVGERPEVKGFHAVMRDGVP